MAKILLWLVAPAELETEQVYSPASPALTASISNKLLRLLVDIDNPCLKLSSNFNFWPFKNQENSNGWSPRDTAQTVDTDSPELTGPSPRVKGTICGDTFEEETLFFWHIKTQWNVNVYTEEKIQ